MRKSDAKLYNYCVNSIVFFCLTTILYNLVIFNDCEYMKVIKCDFYFTDILLALKIPSLSQIFSI